MKAYELKLCEWNKWKTCDRGGYDEKKFYFTTTEKAQQFLNERIATSNQNYPKTFGEITEIEIL